MRRWRLRILPTSYTKTWSFGGWHNRRREVHIERCAILLEAIDALVPDNAFDFPALPDSLRAGEEEARKACPHVWWRATVE